MDLQLRAYAKKDDSREMLTLLYKVLSMEKLDANWAYGVYKKYKDNYIGG